MTGKCRKMQKGPSILRNTTQANAEGAMQKGPSILRNTTQECRRGVQKGRSAEGAIHTPQCRRGHPYSETRPKSAEGECRRGYPYSETRPKRLSRRWTHIACRDSEIWLVSRKSEGAWARGSSRQAGRHRDCCARNGRIQDRDARQSALGENCHNHQAGHGGSQDRTGGANAAWLQRRPCSQATPRRWASACRWSAKPTARGNRWPNRATVSSHDSAET